MSSRTPSTEGLRLLLRTLKLPAIAAHHEEVEAEAARDGWVFSRFLQHLVELEVSERKRRRVERYLKHSGLPSEKTLASLDQARLPTKVRRQLPALCEGGFVEKAENVLAFGLPGRGGAACSSPPTSSSRSGTASSRTR